MLDGVNVIEMNGLTDRAIATLSNPYAYRRSATGTINWIELFKKEPTYILFNMLSTFHYTTQITAIPELQDKLGQFLFVQKSPLGPGVFTLGFNALLVRGDRATLTAFVQDYGAFAPVCEFRNSEYQKYYILPMQDPATGQYRNDFFMTPWDVAPWLTDTGAQLQAAWRSWGRNQRLSCEMPLHAGINEVTKSILDGAPLMLLCELDKKADPQAVVTVIRQKDGVLPEVVASADLREQPKTMRRVWVLPVLGDPSGVGGRITIKAEAAAEGVLRFAAHRWVKVPFPDFPKWFDAADATQ
jgi:hypothetical protein